MKHGTAIEWTHPPGYTGETWNPVVGCQKVSEGCRNCYAKTVHDMRHKAKLDGKKLPEQYAKPFETVQLMERRLADPLSARKPRCYFVNSVSDLFHEDVPDEFIDRVFAVMALCPQHYFLILTKRPERMREYMEKGFGVNQKDMPGHLRVFQAIMAAIGDEEKGGVYHRALPEAIRVDAEQQAPSLGEPGEEFSPQEYIEQGLFGARWPLPNVGLGVSVEDQATADARIPLLLQTPAAMRFVSYEPALGPVDFAEGGHGWLFVDELANGQRTRLDWIITGGESGPNARPMHPDWVRSVRDQCAAAGVAYFFKQHGEWLAESQISSGNGTVYGWRNKETATRHIEGETFYKVGKKAAGHLLDGEEHFDWPPQMMTRAEARS